MFIEISSSWYRNAVSTWTWLLVCMLSFGFCRGQNPIDQIDVPERYQQIVFVLTNSWDSQSGTLSCYSRNEDGWFKEELTTNVVVGKNGLGWGRGLHLQGSTGPEKVEGDGKAPAGIFRPGDAFGYADSFTPGTALNYRALTARDYFVDDVNSEDYNQWKTIPAGEENNPGNYWRSYERMKRSDHLYELGVVVDHNTDPVMKGKGSAIFLHVWRRAASPTVGCTAMHKEDLIRLISWLDPAKEPIIIQIPQGQLDQIKFR